MLLVRRLASCSRRVHIRLLLSLHNVLLVSDSLVAEPVTDLRHRDAALAGKLLLHLEGHRLELFNSIFVRTSSVGYGFERLA